MVKGDDAIAEILSFKAKWDEQKSIKTLQPAWQDGHANAYVPI